MISECKITYVCVQCGSCTFSELCMILMRWSLSLSSGSLQRRTNERLYSSRLAGRNSPSGAKLARSKARYKSPTESACCRRSRCRPVGGSRAPFSHTDDSRTASPPGTAQRARSCKPIYEKQYHHKAFHAFYQHLITQYLFRNRDLSEVKETRS